MIKQCVNGVLGLAGLRLVRIHRTIAEPTCIDPTERNEKGTLDRLWRDPDFRERYLSEDRHRLYSAVVQAVGARSRLSSSRHVIDVGCGPGFFLQTLMTAGYRGNLAGCDFSEGAIECARGACPGSDLFVHDIYTSLEGRYDLLFCMETLEHLLHPERALMNLISAGGTVVLTVPEGRSDSFAGHINFWSLESWEVFIGSVATREARSFEVKKINDGKNLYAEVWQ